MTTSSRYHHGDLRAALLAAAAKLLEKQGRAGLSLRAAARRAGVSHGAPYRHFPDRMRLLAALAEDGFAQLGAQLDAAAARGGLRAMGEAYVGFALAQPQRFGLMFDGKLARRGQGALGKHAARVVARLQVALQEQLPGAAGRDASLAAWSLVHGLAQLLLEERIAHDARAGRELQVFVRRVLDSIRFVAAPPQSEP